MSSRPADSLPVDAVAPISNLMAGEQKGASRRPFGGQKGDSARAERLRAALRENLKRRKAQCKGRAQAKARHSGATHDSAGIVPDKPKG
jgi:hypothetical protein